MSAGYSFRVVPVGDAAVMVICGTRISKAAHLRVQWVLRTVRAFGVPEVIHWVPGYISVLGRIDPSRSSAEEVALWLRDRLNQPPSQNLRPGKRVQRVVEIPVCYGNEFGPDLEELASLNGLSPSQVIEQHVRAHYQVYLIGFVPGFPYLAGLPKELAAPRRTEPRLRVPAGSVGIGGRQTGIYPASTPGGWQLIGRTPAKLFDFGREDPFLLKPGDAVRFIPIDHAAFIDHTNRVGSQTAVPGDVDVVSPSSAERFVHEHGAANVRRAESRCDIEVVRAGLLTTVQDMGRFGYEDQGVARGGAMDRYAAAIANLLVGNRPDAALLECTLVGPGLRFRSDAVICVTGANLSPALNGQELPMWQSVHVPEGSELKFTGYRSGCRAYLACSGGIDVPVVLGSRSTYVAQGLGGIDGRPLQAGDRLTLGLPSASLRRLRGRALPPWARPVYSEEIHVGFLVSQNPSAVRGVRESELSSRTFTLLPQSDRMGLRFAAEHPVKTRKMTVVSEPVLPGTIQCPPSGQPIVLMADAQTVGGYPTIGVVCTADLPKLAQAKPGTRVRFEALSEQTARAKLQAQLQCIKWLTLVNQSHTGV